MSQRSRVGTVILAVALLGGCSASSSKPVCRAVPTNAPSTSSVPSDDKC